MKSAKSIARALIWICCALTCFAQDRPKVGLVLSGGGALGSAHIGVLKALEEMNIPIDMIAGTSMGAIVGGYYAAGYTPSEIETILTELNWQDVLDDEPLRTRMDFRDKFDDPDLLTDFEMGLSKGSFLLPPGLIIGRKVDLLFQLDLFNTTPISDFKDLPIPFVAVATDLVAAESVELDSGLLAKAIRASSTIPGAFAPYEDEQGRLLVDGGLIRNLPVSSLRERGADFIIAVDVGVDHPDPEDLKKLGKITGRIVSVFVRQNVKPEAELADVLIEPSVSEYTANQFDKVKEMIPSGYQTTMQAAAKLEHLKLSKQAYADLQASRKLADFRPLIESIQITNNVGVDPGILLKRVTVELGKVLDLAELEKSLRQLYQLGYFETVNFRLVREEGSEGYHLHFEPVVKSWGPNYIRFGLEMNTDFAGQSGFNLKASHRTRPFNRLEGEINTFLTLGEQNRARSEYHQPLTSRRTWFTAVSLEALEEDFDAIVDDGDLALIQIETISATAGLGYHLGNYGEVRLTYERAQSDASVRSGAVVVDGQTFDNNSFDFGGLSLRMVLDQINNYTFPTDGWLFSVEAFMSRTQYGADMDYEQLQISYGTAHTFGEKHTLLGFTDLYSSLDSEPPVQAWFEEGGLYSISGYPSDFLRGRHGGHATAAYLYKLTELSPVLGGGVYLGVTAEVGNMWRERNQVSTNDLIYASSIAVGADTILGPINLAYGFNDNGESQLYFTLGRSF